METKKEVGQIYKKMSEVMKAIEPIAKGRQNTQQGYKFRGIDDMYNELNGHMAKAGVFAVPEVISAKTEDKLSKSGGAMIWTDLLVKYTFFAEDGSSVYAVTKGEAMDSGDKGSGKAMSTAFKYALMQIFCIPTEDTKDVEYETLELGKPKTTKEVAQRKLESIKPQTDDVVKEGTDGISMTPATQLAIKNKMKDGKYDRSIFEKRGITKRESLSSWAKDNGELLTESEGQEIVKELYVEPKPTKEEIAKKEEQDFLKEMKDVGPKTTKEVADQGK